MIEQGQAVKTAWDVIPPSAIGLSASITGWLGIINGALAIVIALLTIAVLIRKLWWNR